MASDEVSLRREIAKAARIAESDINDFRIIRKSVDARKRPVMFNIKARIAVGDDQSVSVEKEFPGLTPVPDDAPSVIIVGAGPAGLFAAVESIKLGIRPVVLERGLDVDSRRKDIADMTRRKVINPVSNYCFGEGGAGAFSDGKLYTRSKKRGSVEDVLKILVSYGASPEILIESHPHIGSDRLPRIIKSIRESIIEKGGEVHFNALVTGLLIKDGKVIGVVTDKGNFQGDAVILATGHSAHDTFRALYAQGIDMTAKGIAIGVRLEHPQHLIDIIQYHDKSGRGDYLPAAEYSFVTQVDSRGVYSFCMCPGGVVVPAGSGAEELVVNGMSASARSGKWSNSGMVVEIQPGDFPEFSHHGPLEMLELQESLERNMFRKAGNSIVAPAQRMLDFVRKKKSDTLPPTSYAPGISPGDFNELLPDFIASRLRKGFEEFGRKAPGFLTNDAILLGLESRTSSPLRIVRDDQSLQSISLAGLFPAGEGAGYAGGIVSAAVDGVRCAEKASEYIKSSKEHGATNIKTIS